MSRCFTLAGVLGAMFVLLVPSVKAQASFGFPQAPTAPEQAPAAAPPGGPTVSVDADREDAIRVLTRLAAEAQKSIVIAGDFKQTVTLSLRDIPFDQAVALIARAAGLTVQNVDGGYVVGMRERAIYRTRHIRSDRLVETLRATFDPERLQVITGPDEYPSPSLFAQRPGAAGSSEGSSFGASAAAEGFGGGSLTLPGVAGFGAQASGGGVSQASGGGVSQPRLPPAPPGAIDDIILLGDASEVARALDLARETDRPRRQVRFNVKFTNFAFKWLREFGSKFGAKFGTSTLNVGNATLGPSTSGISFDVLIQDPTFITAAVAAAEQNNDTALKAIPSITVLDGERGYILIGEKQLYPKLIGFTQAQTPIFDVSQVNVGITLELGVLVSDAGDIVLTLYPQVSSIVGFLDAGGSRYPQVATLEQQTTVRVRDGETIVIGGLLSEKTVRQMSGIPGLMNIPYLGRLFALESKQIQKQDLVVLITAEIVKDGVQ